MEEMLEKPQLTASRPDRSQVLCLQHNSIRHIPRELGLLKHLETIDLSYNQLEDLPIELAQLPLKVRFSVSPAVCRGDPPPPHKN